jgi:hypothetical protein
VVILGNSHLKRSVLRTGDYFSSKFEFSRFIKPDAGFETIVGRTIMDSISLTKNDVVMLSGRIIDVCISNSKKGDIADCEVFSGQ